MPIELGELRLFTLEELSEKLGLTTVTLRTYIKEGRLKGRKAGVRWYVTEEALREFFASGSPADDHDEE